MTYTEGFYTIDDIPFLKTGDRYMSDFQLVSVLYNYLLNCLCVTNISLYARSFSNTHNFLKGRTTISFK